MFQNLSDQLAQAFKHLSGNAIITELNIASAIKDIRKALLDADVNYKIAKEFTDIIKQKAVGTKVVGALKPDQVFTKIIQDELTELLGGNSATLNLNNNPSIILLAGLQGSGKTTFAVKLANYLKQQNKNPLLIAADIYRPAAMEQLRILAEKIEATTFIDSDNKNVEDIVRKGLDYAKENKNNVVIIDTAGRLSVDETLMNEIKNLKTTFNPDETLFIIDSMIGQEAVEIAKTFNEYLDITGVVLTKLDSDTRGGAALSVKSILNKPIQFISNGEKIENIDIFYPERLAQRILGMGDVATLVEKAEKLFSEKEAQKLQAKITKNKFDYEDFRSQIKNIKNMGNMKDMLSMVPGVGSKLKNVNIDETRFTKIEAIINSMTLDERHNPQLLNASRKTRIAKGSGHSLTDVNSFVTQFEQMKKMMQQFSKGGQMPFNIPGL